MQIFQYSLGQLQANCYFLIQDKECLIIDPADDASFILEELQRRNLTLMGMFATHGHFDHVMAAGEIQKSFNVSLYVFKEDMFLIDRLVQTAEHFLGYKPVIFKPINIKFLNEGELKIENCLPRKISKKFIWGKLEILSTPGHTPGSYCVYFRKENVIFTGDTLFKQGIGRYDHSYSSKKDLQSSLNKIFKLPEETIVYSGHGEQTTIKEEKGVL